uniref:Interferon regulatory factor 4-like n=1 Tax=Salarias fasciatus TaxID=181472 RepID=A0A672FEB9_SALFA
MNPEADYGGSGSSGNGKLRQWLIEQVDCGKYPGLVWENDEKSIFRIPWKHAGKQDYNRDEDAALFKAWALFKGKFREGIDKPDPPTWKTRLRCRSQLDISDPYKVYRIIPEGAKKRPRQEDSPLSPVSYQMHPSYTAVPTQMPQYMPTPDCGWRDYCQEPASLPELPFPQCPCPPRSLPWQGPSMENGYQLRASIYSYGPDSQPSPFTLDAGIRPAEALPDYRLHVSVYSRDTLVREVTTSSPDGCHITPYSPEKHYLTPGSPEVVPLPVDGPSAQRRADECPSSPPSGLERGVLLWMAADGLYARRLCQSRVYWQRGPAGYGDKFNKLERDVNCKLLHTGLPDSYTLHGRPLPAFLVLLSFGDECLDPQRQRRTLTVQVEPLFAAAPVLPPADGLLPQLRAPGVTEHMNSSEDYQRAITHHHSGSLQE